jgi:hypothetical protein
MDKIILEDVTAYAEALMSKDDIKKIIQVPESDFNQTLFDQAFDRGFLLSKYTVQKSIVDLAKSGSSPAQTMASRLIQDIDIKEGNG